MTDQDDEPLELVEQIALWLLVNDMRPNWELLAMLGAGWPDATAAELAKAWQRMTEMRIRQFERDVEPIKRRAGLRTVEGGTDDNS